MSVWVQREAAGRLGRVCSGAPSARTRRGADRRREFVCASIGMLLATINSGTLLIALGELEEADDRRSARA
jgi:hypothetical protein